MGGFGIVFRYSLIRKLKQNTKLSWGWVKVGRELEISCCRQTWLDTHRNESWKRTESFNNIYRIIWYGGKWDEQNWEKHWEKRVADPLFFVFSSSIWFTDRFLSCKPHTILLVFVFVFVIIIIRVCLCACLRQSFIFALCLRFSLATLIIFKTAKGYKQIILLLCIDRNCTIC